ncbi:hypothetical protein DIPPA_35621 [Diplonema papillatum]|nr:hypothetical protein DIPPA_35621 [Diplonema papillatum]
MAPLLNGFELVGNPFGFVTCDATPIKPEFSVPNVDCCATTCEQEDTCMFFTFNNSALTCSTYDSCSKQENHERIEGCAFESCFDGYGAHTYKRKAKSYHIVDRFPGTFPTAAKGQKSAD